MNAVPGTRREEPPCLDLQGRTCKRRDCTWRGCGPRWIRNWQTSTRINLDVGYGGELLMFTVTPPGADVLPWSGWRIDSRTGQRRRCGESHHHGPRHGCLVDDDAADGWAAECRENWKGLRDAARKAVKHHGLQTQHLVLERAWEPQKRGVPHLHGVAGYRHGDRFATRVFLVEIARRAQQYGFGPITHPSPRPRDLRRLDLASLEEIGWRSDADAGELYDAELARLQVFALARALNLDEFVRDGAAAAKYLAGYLGGRVRRKGSIRENISHPRMPRSLLWITPRLTRTTLCTMRRLRYAGWYFAVCRGYGNVVPRLYGEIAVEVAKLVTLLERRRIGGSDDEEADGLDFERRWRAHLRTLQHMRRLYLRSVAA